MSLNNIKLDYQTARHFKQSRHSNIPVTQSTDTHKAKYTIKNISDLVSVRMIGWLEKEDSQILIFFIYSLFITGYLYLFAKTLIIL